jgi:hypothetical protein
MCRKRRGMTIITSIYALTARSSQLKIFKKARSKSQKKKRLPLWDSHFNLIWRLRADSNRCTRFCRPLPSRSATQPFLRARKYSRNIFDFPNINQEEYYSLLSGACILYPICCSIFTLSLIISSSVRSSFSSLNMLIPL